MGFFSRKNNGLDSELESLHLNEGDGEAADAALPFGFNQAKPARYTIDQAVKLVRSLQKHRVSAEVIAGIMQQTLASVDIHFTDIIADAKRREAQIQTDSEAKSQQIAELTQKLEKLKEEKIKLQEEFKEITVVREFLQQSVPEKPNLSLAASTPASVAASQESTNADRFDV